MNVDIKVQGLDKVMKDFSIAGMKAQGEADKTTETYARKMANDASSNAPVDSGDLRANIAASPRRLKLATWEFGGTLPYARRQEYENRTHKGFIRKAVWNNRAEYRDAVKRAVIKR